MPLFSCPCYEVEVNKGLKYKAFRGRFWKSKGNIPFLSKLPFYCVTNKKRKEYPHGSFQSREKQRLYRHEQSSSAKQRANAKSKGLALTDAFTSGKLGLYPCRTFPYQQRKMPFVPLSWSLLFHLFLNLYNNGKLLFAKNSKIQISWKNFKR